MESKQQMDVAHPATADFERAIALYTAGRAAEAEAECRAVLAAEPRHGHALQMLGLLRAESGQPEEGLALIRQALATGLVHPALHLAHAETLVRLERHAEALAAVQRSLALDPADPRPRRLLGVCLTRLMRYREAAQVLEAALAVQPQDAGLLGALGVLRMAEGRYAEAGEVLERALAMDPDQADAHGNLAVVYERSNRREEAAQLVQEGLKRWPRHATLQLIEAQLARQAGAAARARELLDALQPVQLAPAFRRDVEFERGWCADALGEREAALAHFAIANRMAEEQVHPTPELLAVYPRQLDAMVRLYGALPHETAAPPPDPDAPVFLTGFPRSGTTLLDTMLGAHAGLTVMEEQPAIQALLDEYHAAGHDYLGAVPRLTPELRACLRQAYFHAAVPVRRGTRLVDKSPFATAHLGLLQQVFPGAPMLLVVRHPCDVVLSCFMNNFQFNSGTVHFTSLAGAVRLYAGVMRVWRTYQQHLPLNYRIVRYEDLVTEPRAELQKLLEFLGVPWSEEVLAHEAAALKRGRIPTPSYQQVSRPLYKDASGRWKRYREALVPFMAELRPSIEAFGYEE